MALIAITLKSGVTVTAKVKDYHFTRDTATWTHYTDQTDSKLVRLNLDEVAAIVQLKG